MGIRCNHYASYWSMWIAIVRHDFLATPHCESQLTDIVAKPRKHLYALQCDKSRTSEPYTLVDKGMECTNLSTPHRQLYTVIRRRHHNCGIIFATTKHIEHLHI